jgi:arsenate reductase
LLNKRSKTWRDFDTEARECAEADPVAVLLAHPTLIKRPILETSSATLAGFSATRYEVALAGAD